MLFFSNYLDVVKENEGFVFAGVVMLWNGLNEFLFLRKLLYFSCCFVKYEHLLILKTP